MATVEHVQAALSVVRDSVAARSYEGKVWRGLNVERCYLRSNGKDIGYVEVRDGTIRTQNVTRGRGDVEAMLRAAGIEC